MRLRWMGFTLTGMMVLCVCGLLRAEPTASLPDPQCPPLVRGVLWWVNPKATTEQITRELDAMGAVGMDLLWVFGSNDFLTAPDNAVLKHIYNEADRRHWRVIIATSANGDWYKDWDIPRLKKIEEHNMKAIAGLYSHHPSFFGWYINYEVYMCWGSQASKFQELLHHIGWINRELGLSAKLTISPFFLADKDHVRGNFRYAEPEEFAVWWTEIIRQTGINIVMLQDSGAVHSECVSRETRVAFFEAMQSACRHNGAQLWGNVEFVEHRAKDWADYGRQLKESREAGKPCPWSLDMTRNAWKLDLASRFGTNIVSWGWEYWNPLSANNQAGLNADNYAAYGAYYEPIAKTMK